MEHCIYRVALSAAVILGLFNSTVSAGEPEMLVLMNGSGRVERYNVETGLHVGTLLSGLPPSNSILLDDDGRLLISTGNPQEMGTVLRYDPVNGGHVESFINVPEGYGGRLHRATGMCWYEGDLLVASQNDGKVKRFAYPSGEWQEDIALATPGGMTQIVAHEATLFVTDYQAQAIRQTKKLDGGMTEVWAQYLGQHPWGLAIDAKGTAYWSTSANRILRTDAMVTSEFAGSGGGIATPLSLTLGPDGLLYCASWLGPVTAWRTDTQNDGAPHRTFDGPEVKGPISIIFTERSFPAEFIYLPTGQLDETPAKVAFFESHIRPILQDRCVDCHNQETCEGGLRLDSRAGWDLGGRSGRAIQPGKPEDSLAYQAVTYLDKDLQMPPDSQLSKEEIALLREWIVTGAIDPRSGEPEPVDSAADSWPETFRQRLDWWSLKPMAWVTPPETSNAEWSVSPVDRFIRFELDRNGLQPAPPALAEDLLRRVSFVLTGLPPTVEQRERFIEAWQHDTEVAYQALVDELIASPHYGEAMARRWMDVVRYTDTYGYEWDNPVKGSHEYRDYLIRAFNQDVGFDTFLREQIAGDLLPQPRIDNELGIIESLIGPVFYHMGEHRHGSSRDFNGIHQEMVNNKIDALSKAFLATTVACSRCHDHKLEAVSQRDYYALGAMLITPRWASRPVDAPQKNAAAIARLSELRKSIRTELAAIWRDATVSPENLQQVVLVDDDANSPALGDVDYPLSKLLKADSEIESAWDMVQSEWLTQRAARAETNKSFTYLADFATPQLPSGWVMEGDGIETGWVDDGTPLIALNG